MSISDLPAENIQSAAARVAQLAHQGSEVGDFYQHFLDELPVPAGTLGSVAWLCEPDAFRKIAVGSRNPAAGVQLPYTNDEHTAMLLKARDTGETQIFEPPVQSDYQVFVENVLPPTAIVPVVVEATARVLIEVFLPPAQRDELYDDFCRDAAILCQIATNYHRGHRSVAGGRRGLPADVYKSLRVLDTCYALANEGRQTLGCDRVSLLVAKGNKQIVKAVSGQESVNRRANVVRFLERLTARVLKTGQAFWYPEDAAELAPEIERELEQYVEAAMCRRLGILPLSVTEHEHDQQADEEKLAEGEIYGALVVEDFTDTVDRGADFKTEVTQTADEAAISLRNAVDHESIFLLPVWRFLGDQKRRFFGTKRRLTVAVLSAAAIVGLILALVRVPFNVASEGHLQPEVRRNVFAPIGGTVRELHVTHGSQVQEDDLLAELHNPEIDLALEELRSQIRQAEARLAALRTEQLSALDGDDDQGMNAAAEAAELEKTLASLFEQLKIQNELKAKMKIVSPIAGEIVTWNVEDRLKDRPVTVGQTLLKVAQLDGPWRLELNFPDRRVAHLLRAQAASDQPLEVSFILASDPGKRFQGRVQQVARATRVDATEGQNLLVLVQIDDPNIDCRRAGTGVQAKVNCGRRSMGYVWLHDILEFIQSRILFRFS